MSGRELEHPQGQGCHEVSCPSAWWQVPQNKKHCRQHQKAGLVGSTSHGTVRWRTEKQQRESRARCVGTVTGMKLRDMQCHHMCRSCDVETWVPGLPSMALLWGTCAQG